MSYWETRHEEYSDPDSGLSKRLALVQQTISEFLDHTAPRPVTVLSLCAGDGRDLLGVLTGRPDADRVSATLVELDPELVRRAGESARAYPQVVVRQADAGDPRTYDGLPPADLVLVCGVFGNISDHDVRHTIDALPALCAPGARVVWTRTRREPDLTPDVRNQFRRNGFHERSFTSIADSLGAVGVADLVSAPATTLGTDRLFTFTRLTQNERTRLAYESRAARYREAETRLDSRNHEFLDQLVARVGADAHVLELGSGTGRDAAYLTRAGLRVQTSDVTTGFLDGLRADGWEPRRIDLLADTLPADLGGAWDAVFASAVLLHVPRAQLPEVMSAIRGATRPGGVFAFTLKEGDGEAWSSRKLGLPRHFTYWREQPLREVLDDTGWRLETLDHVEGLLEPWLCITATPADRPG